MFAGIGAGTLSVLFICGSYIFSREYVRKHKDPVKLSVMSQLVMGIGGVILLWVSSRFYTIEWTGKLCWLLAGQVITFLMGQTAFFAMLRRVESSRAAALLDNRDYVLPDDIRDLAPVVLSHRIVLSGESRYAGLKASEVLADIIRKVSIPL